MRLLWFSALSVCLLVAISFQTKDRDFVLLDSPAALSDLRYKHKIETLDIGGIETVLKLRPVSFYWKEATDEGMKGEQLGFIAQDVEKILPAAVVTGTNAEKTKGIRYNAIIPVLAKAIQEQTQLVKNLSARIDEQKTQIENQEKEIAALKRER